MKLATKTAPLFKPCAGLEFSTWWSEVDLEQLDTEQLEWITGYLGYILRVHPDDQAALEAWLGERGRELVNGYVVAPPVAEPADPVAPERELEPPTGAVEAPPLSELEPPPATEPRRRTRR